MTRGNNVLSTEVTADDAVLTGPGYLWGCVLTGGSDAATIVLYDNTAASGTKLLTIKVAASATQPVMFKRPVRVKNGIYADISGTSPAAYVLSE